MKIIIKASALSSLALCTAALAGPFNINAGLNNDPSNNAFYGLPGDPFATAQECSDAGGTPDNRGNCDGLPSAQSVSEAINFGFNINNATSVYYNTSDFGSSTNVDLGDFFTDTGTSEITNFGGNGNLGFADDLGFKDTWTLTFDYSLYGVVVDSGNELAGAITGGFFNIYYNDLTASDNTEQAPGVDRTKVLSVAVTNSSGPLLTSVGLNLNGVIDYSASVNDNFDTSNQFVTDFFEFTTPKTIAGTTSQNFFDLWSAGFNASPQQFIDTLTVTTLNGRLGNGLIKVDEVTYDSAAKININQDDYSEVQNSILEENMFTAYGLAPSDLPSFLDETYASGQRSGETLSGNLSIVSVSAPSSLALFGLSLIGMVVAGRRKK